MGLPEGGGVEVIKLAGAAASPQLEEVGGRLSLVLQGGELREPQVHASASIQVAADGVYAAWKPRAFLCQCIAEGSVGDEAVSPASILSINPSRFQFH